MMNGEVVAWRVNRDYTAIECYQERPLGKIIDKESGVNFGRKPHPQTKIAQSLIKQGKPFKMVVERIKYHELLILDWKNKLTLHDKWTLSYED
ncbi:hypothetical protein G8G26_004059 [Escherichia coli]|nr:hypothetical protein [Escherichia coli]HBA6997436.1 hypothetical protein [Escherichia coli]HBA7809639.1 hypothetical protein [Escherichia coli]HBA8417672.1 hypothetical protein [Escherichia coli]